MNSINLPEGARLTYTVSHEAWYWAATRNAERYDGELMVHASAPDGGVHWEFAVRRYDLGGRHHLRVEIFDETWRAFEQIRPFFDGLQAGGVATLDDVRELLDTYGAQDVTARVSPYPQDDSTIVPVELSGRDLNQILTALDNRGDETNGDPAMGTLVARLRTIAARLGR